MLDNYFALIIFACFALSPTFTYVSQNPHTILDDINKCILKVDSINNDALNCDVHVVENHNNEIYTLLSKLLQKPYFRFFKVNLNKKCPFWPDNRICASQNCYVKTCDKNALPFGLRDLDKLNNKLGHKPVPDKILPEENTQCNDSEITSNISDDGVDRKSKDLLNSVNHTISSDDRKAFEDWNEYDSTALNFCELDDDSSADCEYVDLLLNPEQFTDYSGYASHRVWEAIYRENCFHSNGKRWRRGYGLSHDSIKNLCFEKRAFYMALSGLHASITIHLCSKYYFPRDESRSSVNSRGSGKESEPSKRSGEKFQHNPVEFCNRFDINATHGEGPMRLRNLYFTYLLEMRALAKIAHYLENENFFTGNEEDDLMVNKTMRSLLGLVKTFPCHFEEHLMFQGKDSESHSLKINVVTMPYLKCDSLFDFLTEINPFRHFVQAQFRSHFRNISRIMDCVSCDKCRLWGKIQTQGLGTALKILFGTNVTRRSRKHFHLKRGEIVSLINAFGRLSNSIHEISAYYRNVNEEEIGEAIYALNIGKTTKPPFMPLTTTTFNNLRSPQDKEL